MASFVVRAPGVREIQEIYLNPSCCENVETWTSTNCLSNLLGIYFQQVNSTQEALKSQCRTVELDFVDQPSEEKQDETYNDAAPYIFCFVFTSSMKNYTEGFIGYLKNKAKGLIRSIERTGMVIVADENDLSQLIPNGEVLTTLRDFFDNHPTVLELLTQHVLALANPNADITGPVTTYAIETLTSMEYVYMTGVGLIEEYLVEPRHPVCMHHSVSSYLKNYMVYTQEMKAKYGTNWIYSAILERSAWRTFARSKSHKELWMIAAIIAGKEVSSFNDMVIYDRNVGKTAGEPKYRRLIGNFQEAGNHMTVAGDLFGTRETDFISNFLNNAANPRTNPPLDDVSAMSSLRSMRR